MRLRSQADSFSVETGALDTIRTCDPKFRKLVFYPAELRGHEIWRASTEPNFATRGARRLAPSSPIEIFFELLPPSFSSWLGDFIRIPLEQLEEDLVGQEGLEPSILPTLKEGASTSSATSPLSFLISKLSNSSSCSAGHFALQI